VQQAGWRGSTRIMCLVQHWLRLRRGGRRARGPLRPRLRRHLAKQQGSANVCERMHAWVVIAGASGVLIDHSKRTMHCACKCSRRHLHCALHRGRRTTSWHGGLAVSRNCRHTARAPEHSRPPSATTHCRIRNVLHTMT
jgi:hypothetical protein